MKILLLLLTVSFSAVSFAGTKYAGHTQSGDYCEFEIKGDLFFSINWENSKADLDSRSQSCDFNSKTTIIKAKSLEVMEGLESSNCKARIFFDNDGNAIKADLGIGNLFKLDYDVTCQNLYLLK
jgi:hypothetical protein